VPTALNDAFWFWRVRAVNAQGRPGLWSPARLLWVDTVAPPAPTLYLPANASVTTLTRPTLIWLPVAGASGYRVDISTDPAFTSFVLENQPAVPNYLLLPAPLSQGRYFWRAQAVDAAGNLSGESAAFQLVINIGSLPAPNTTFTTYPTLPTARPTFVWVAQTGAPTYTLEIAANASFSSVLYSADVALNYHVLPLANALPDGVYFWRVRVNGETLPPTVFSRFTVSPPPAPAPIQTGPAYAAQLPSSAPALAWNPVPPTAAGGPFTYELQLDRVSWFGSAALLNYTQADGVSASGFTVPGPLADGYWFWRVRAVNAQGRPGTWSRAYYFAVGGHRRPARAHALPPGQRQRRLHPAAGICLVPGAGRCPLRDRAQHQPEFHHTAAGRLCLEQLCAARAAAAHDLFLACPRLRRGGQRLRLERGAHPQGRVAAVCCAPAQPLHRHANADVDAH
jgi:hypothetical protein